MSHADDIARLLPWYAAGTLEVDERRRVERHLDVCAECRESLALAREAVAHGAPESLAAHVHAELLTDFVREPEKLDADVTERIAAHLDGCEVCADAATIVRQLSLDDETVATPADDRGPWWQRLWSFLGTTVLQPAPALAYLLLLLVSFPLYRALAPREAAPAGPGSVVDVSGPLHINYLGRATRGQTTTRVTAPTERRFVYLGIEPELAEDVADDSPFVVEILRGGRTRWSHGLTAAEIRRALASDQLAVVLAVPAAALPAGTHVLRVRPAAGGDLVLEVPFEIAP